MKKLALLAAVLAALTLVSTAAADTSGRFAGTPTCSGNTTGSVTCTGRVAGLGNAATFVAVYYQTIWACVADPTITVTADNGISGPGAYTENGKLFTTTNGARTPLFYEIIFGIDFGCAGENWTAIRYDNVVLALWPNIDVTYDVGTIYPS